MEVYLGRCGSLKAPSVDGGVQKRKEGFSGNFENIYTPPGQEG